MDPIIARELGRGLVMPKDLSGFTLALFSNLIGIGFECIAWISSANLPFASFLYLFTLTNIKYDFLASECTAVWCRDPILGCL